MKKPVPPTKIIYGYAHDSAPPVRMAREPAQGNKPSSPVKGSAGANKKPRK
jgi:hypothetical protein